MSFGALTVLIRKNVLLSVRRSAALPVTFIAPFFAMLILYLRQRSIERGEVFSPELLETRDPIPRQVTTIPRCVPFATDDCITVAYVPSNNLLVSTWVNTVATNNNIPPEEISAFANSDALNSYLVANPNKTQAAYIFDEYALDQIDGDNVTFIVQYNETDQFVFPIDSARFHEEVVLPAMIHQMSMVMISDLSGKQLKVDLNASVFPHPSIIEDDGGTIQVSFAQTVGFVTYAVFFLVLLFFLYHIVKEKERGLRHAMQLAGQTQSQHYISWLIPYFIVNLIILFELIIFGLIFNFRLFRITNFFVYFITMLIFSVSLMAIAMLLAAVITKTSLISIISFMVFIFSYLIASAGVIVYKQDLSKSVWFLRQVFAILPPTMYIKALIDMAIAAEIPGCHLTVSNNDLPSYCTIFDTFPIAQCWYWMLGSTVVITLISIFLDNVVPTEHGSPLSPLYPFQLSYWFPPKADAEAISAFTKSATEGGADSNGTSITPISNICRYDPNLEDADVKVEREAVFRGDCDNAGLVIKNASKKFRSKLAVDDVSFSVPCNTAFALLGSNGAGKSTLFKLLSTSLRSSSGDAFIYGLSVRHQRQAVRKLLGVCPQFDLYWDTLTGAEHIEVFARLKGLTRTESKAETKARLLDVELVSKADVYAGDYSGGMQRRLSVALSLTGDPKIILLDECTSGADPLVRRDLWTAIERAKSGRVVFLITHSMAEAEHIAGRNKIGIMAQGKLRVLGDALHLKSKFGAGHTIIIILEHENRIQPLSHILTSICSSISLASSYSGENGQAFATYVLPRTASDDEILRTLQCLDSQRDTYGIIEYSINSTSLGEVFKSITSLSRDAVERGENRDEAKKRRIACCL